MRPRSAVGNATTSSGQKRPPDASDNKKGGSSHHHSTPNSKQHQQHTSHNSRDIDFFDDFYLSNAEGQPVELTRFRGRVVIVTNIGTFAPNAKSELEGLNNLAHCFGEKLAIIGVPSNHFFHEPTANTTETLAVMEHVRPGRSFRPDPMSFFITAHGDCNGVNQLPVFRYLKRELPLPSDDQFSFASGETAAFRISWNPVERSDVTSDFEKFIIRPDGKACRRFSGQYRADNLYHDIARLVEEFSLTAESAHLSSLRFLRPPVKQTGSEEDKNSHHLQQHIVIASSS